METGIPDENSQAPRGLSSEKREDLWALLIAAMVMVACTAAPEAVFHFFKKVLYIF